jgi:hypothetical protein
MCRKKPKPRQFFLFNDILVYGTILLSKRKYNRQHLIPLEDVQIEDLADEDGMFVATNKIKYFAILYRLAQWFPNKDTREIIRCLCRYINREKGMDGAHTKMHFGGLSLLLHSSCCFCLKDLLSKSGKRAATEHAAVWVQDIEANRCMACNKTQFNFIQRRVC